MAAVALAVSLPGPPAVAAVSAPVWHTRPATYGIARTNDVHIRMSDGVLLDADVYRPADSDGAPAAGRFPVVLTQTPYNKNSGVLAFEAPFLIERGYVQVIVDVRGTGSSEGTWDSFGAREQRDGAELVRWAAAEPWSDGRVALHGTSYGAINQLFTAAQQPKGLKAIFPVVPMSDAYRDVAVTGGQVDTSFIPFWLGLVTGLSLLPSESTPSDPAQGGSVVAQHARGATAFQAPAVASAVQGGATAYDGPFYRLRSPIEVIDRVRVPTFVVGGWYDLFQRGEPLLYQRLASNGVPARLLMGPWYHITEGQGLPADGVPGLPELELHWFDHYVLGRTDDDLARLAPVTYYRLGLGHYLASPSWPPPHVSYRLAYLAGPASPGRPGSLRAAPPKAPQPPDRMPWQPLSGACTRSTVQWTAGAGSGTPCETDQRANDATGLAYDIPLPVDVSLAGPVAAGLYVGTNGHDSLLTVRIENVSPDGTATQVTSGWCTISLRALDQARSVTVHGVMVRPYHPFTRSSLEPAGRDHVYLVWVEVFPTAAMIAGGHTLRVSIQPSDAPHLSGSLPQAEHEAGGVLEIYHDARFPSVVVFPQQL